MAYKTVTTIVCSESADKAALNAAIEVAQRESAHLDIICLGIDRTQPGFYYGGAGAGTIAMQVSFAEAESDAQKLEEFATKHLTSQQITWSVRPLAAQSTGLSQFLAHQIRFSELIVLPKPYGEGRGHEAEAIVESALFDARIPVLVVPGEKPLPPLTGTIVIGWNEGRQALAAIRSALPMLIAADSVDIAIIDPPSHGPERSDPGGALAQMLSRHGIHAEVSVLAKTMPRVSDILCRHMTDKDANLLVMGAYGHSRFRESILGGATRNMLQMAQFPVLMAH